MKAKLTSRKLWAALAGVCTGIGLIVAGDTGNGAVVVCSSILGYLAAEAGVDIARVKEVVEDVEDFVEEVIDGTDSE